MYKSTSRNQQARLGGIRGKSSTKGKISHDCKSCGSRAGLPCKKFKVVHGQRIFKGYKKTYCKDRGL